MKNYSLFCYDFLFNDHLGKCSNEAKLLYIKLHFYANNGFVPNVKGILDSLGYDKSVLQELINAEELLTIPGREEVFITSYYVHNRGVKHTSWLKTPYAQYWKNKLWTKKNGIATLKPYSKEEDEKPTPAEKHEESKSWDEMLNDIHA